MPELFFNLPIQPSPATDSGTGGIPGGTAPVADGASRGPAFQSVIHSLAGQPLPVEGRGPFNEARGTQAEGVIQALSLAGKQLPPGTASGPDVAAPPVAGVIPEGGLEAVLPEADAEAIRRMMANLAGDGVEPEGVAAAPDIPAVVTTPAVPGEVLPGHSPGAERALGLPVTPSVGPVVPPPNGAVVATPTAPGVAELPESPAVLQVAQDFQARAVVPRQGGLAGSRPGPDTEQRVIPLSVDVSRETLQNVQREAQAGLHERLEAEDVLNRLRSEAGLAEQAAQVLKTRGGRIPHTARAVPDLAQLVGMVSLAGREPSAGGMPPAAGIVSAPVAGGATVAQGSAVFNLHAPFQQSGWSEAVGERVVWMQNHKIQGAQLRLNPAELGPVEVRVDVRNDQATVNFTAHHGTVREALEAALPRLREMFANNGIDLVDVNVSHQSGSEQRRDVQQNHHHAFGTPAMAGGDDVGDDVTHVPLRRQANGLIDTFA